MEKRRIERREEREIHELLQEHKAERDLEKAIQAEDDLVQEEKDDEIMEELDEIFDETEMVDNVKSYWNQPLPGGGKMPSGPSDESSQILLQFKKKTNGPVPQPYLWAWQGPPSEGKKGKYANCQKTEGFKSGKGPTQDSTRSGST